MTTIGPDLQTLARRAASSLALLTLGVAPLAAQDLAAERGRVLTVVGHAKGVDLPLFPLADGTGVVFRQELFEPGAESLRAHLVVERPGEAWGVQLTNAAGEVVWSTWDGAVEGADFWTDEVAGERATVEVLSSRPANPLRLRIEEVAIGEPEVVPVSITFPNQLATIVGQEDWIVELGRSVARLRFVGDDGGVFVCTAFLVTPDLMLTNQHCIATDSEMLSALVDFDFDEEGTIGSTLRLRELLDTDHGLDYSVVRLDRCVGRLPLRLESTNPPDDEQLLIVQHPGGEPKQVSIADCTVDGPLVPGRAGDDTDFGHQCDTRGGSSGSPVFDFETRRVVGLHHLGINPASGDLFNRAVHIDQVLADLDAALRAEIEAGQ